MPWPKPLYSKSDINKAGEIISSEIPDPEEVGWAQRVLANWRACHGYPINTFQATLRSNVGAIDEKGIVAQRLKRTPSIVTKLRRFPKMQLARMQDIGGLRAIVGKIESVKTLQSLYVDNGRLKHELVNQKDYIDTPKSDGYRGIHLIYRYVNPRAPDYDGLSIEMQLRTRLQHAWATAVETMGIFLGQALKSRQGEEKWLRFFEIASAAFSIMEDSPVAAEWAHLGRDEVYKCLQDTEKELDVLEILSGFTVAISAITQSGGSGAYHLVVLDTTNKTVHVTPFSHNRLDEAVEEYSREEAKIVKGVPLEAVLVKAGSVDQLRRAYPNYFLDTSEFVRKVRTAVPNKKNRPHQKRLF